MIVLDIDYEILTKNYTQLIERTIQVLIIESYVTTIIYVIRDDIISDDKCCYKKRTICDDKTLQIGFVLLIQKRRRL